MLPFGKKLRVRNFVVLKYKKSLRPSELKELRNQKGIPSEVQRHLQRGGLPYIKVETLAGDWSAEFICASTMYNYIDTRRMMTEPGFENQLTQDSLDSLHNLFVLMYADCTILGDAEYLEAKALALKAYMERKMGGGEPETAEAKAEDDKVTEELAADERAKATIVDMASEIAAAQEAAMNVDHEILCIIQDHALVTQYLDQLCCACENPAVEVPNFIPVTNESLLTDRLTTITEHIKELRKKLL